VYNYASDEWYPPWSRAIVLKTGMNLKGSDSRYYTFGGSSAGWLMKLETDTTDKNVSNEDVSISHSIKTRAISQTYDKSTTSYMTLRNIWAEMKARASGSLTTTLFEDLETTGSALATPAALSMVSASSFGMVCPKLDLSAQRLSMFQVEFALDTADAEMEIWSILYALETRGVPSG